MNRIREYEELLRNRYTRLYGKSGSDLWVKKELKKMFVLITSMFILLLSVVVSDITDQKKEYSNVRLDNKGNIVSVIRPQQGEESYSFTTTAIVVKGERRIEKEYYITIEPAGEYTAESDSEVFPEESVEDTVDQQLKKMIAGLNEDTVSGEVQLPGQLEDGCKIVWKKAEKADFIVYLVITLFLIWLIYHNRFYTISKEEKKAQESIIKELPEFINKMVLLVNAGVVLNAAFLKIVDDCDKRKISESYFYSRIYGIGNLIRETNASFYNEMYYFAKHSGVKELMRITNIILDNVDKGDDLADKLRRENELLWLARKQQAEEKGKLAETKLTLPLMILLTVLIAVTIAPALMEI